MIHESKKKEWKNLVKNIKAFWGTGAPKQEKEQRRALKREPKQ